MSDLQNIEAMNSPDHLMKATKGRCHIQAIERDLRGLDNTAQEKRKIDTL